MTKYVSVPDGLSEPFERSEREVARLFEELQHSPERGTIHIGEDRYLLLRSESLYLALFGALEESFGTTMAGEFLYNAARELGHSDSDAFARRLGLGVGVERLSSGPVHFAFSGWARVEILEDSVPVANESFFLHYRHPNTFEAEVTLARKGKAEHPVCLFSAGYSSGWCSAAFGLELHATEQSCVACGAPHCEFVMATFERLERIRGERIS